MKKVICDVCGTAFSDSSDQCPICGYAKPADLGESADVSGEGTADTTYTYVKGGRYSKSNVRKRNKAAGITRAPEPEDDEEEYYEAPENGSTKGLVIAVVVLLLAILAVIAYIVVFLMGDSTPPAQTDGTSPSYGQIQTTAGTTVPETTVPETTEADLSCTGLELAQAELLLSAQGAVAQITVLPQPEDTTDQIVYSSSDPEVASVTQDGTVTAVGPGEAQITVTCGEVSAVCKISCQFEIVETTPDGVVIGGNYAMKIDGQNVQTRRFKNEVSISRNESFMLTLVDLDTDEILDVQWVCEDETVASVDGNKVTGVFSSGRTQTKITYTVGDVTFTCIVRAS